MTVPFGSMGVSLCAVLAICMAGCRCQDNGTAAKQSGPSPSGSSSAAPPVRLPPLQGASWREEVAVEGFGPASVSVPLGATKPRPVVIVLHGHGDRPEWQCGSFRAIAGDHVFVLCPRGSEVKMGGEQRFSFESFERTEEETRAALRALKQRFGPYVAGGSVVLAGFSLGAEHAALLQRREPSFFSHLVLVEGGERTWSSTLARVFAAGGGKRILFACGQPSCAAIAKRKVLFTERAGAEAKLADAGNIGHVLDGRMVQAIAPHFGWLVAGDARFQK